MFLIVATKSLNDGTKGFRFNVLGQKGFARKRKHTSRGWFTTNVGDTFRQFHFGKFTVAFERKVSNPKLRHFAG